MIYRVEMNAEQKGMVGEKRAKKIRPGGSNAAWPNRLISEQV